MRRRSSAVGPDPDGPLPAGRLRQQRDLRKRGAECHSLSIHACYEKMAATQSAAEPLACDLVTLKTARGWRETAGTSPKHFLRGEA